MKSAAPVSATSRAPTSAPKRDTASDHSQTSLGSSAFRRSKVAPSRPLDEGKRAVVAEANPPLAPATLASDGLADRQAIEELIGNDNHRHSARNRVEPIGPARVRSGAGLKTA